MSDLNFGRWNQTYWILALQLFMTRTTKASHHSTENPSVKPLIYIYLLVLFTSQSSLVLAKKQLTQKYLISQWSVMPPNKLLHMTITT